MLSPLGVMPVLSTERADSRSCVGNNSSDCGVFAGNGSTANAGLGIGDDNGKSSADAVDRPEWLGVGKQREEKGDCERCGFHGSKVTFRWPVAMAKVCHLLNLG